MVLVLVRFESETHTWSCNAELQVTTLPNHYDNIVLTYSKLDVNDTIYDIIFEDVQIIQDENVIIFKSKKPSTEVGIFTLCDFLYPETNTLLELASYYDGQILLHDNSSTLFYNRSTKEGTLAPYFTFVTGYDN